MESSGNTAKPLAVGALVLGIVALVASLAGILRKPEAAAGTDARTVELEGRLEAMQARLGRLEAAPAAPSTPADQGPAIIRLRNELTALQAEVRLMASAASAPAPAPKAAYEPLGTSGKTLRVERLEVVDAAGNVRAFVDVVPGSGPSLRLQDQKGLVRVEVLVGADGSPQVIFADKDGKRYSLIPLVAGSSR